MTISRSTNLKTAKLMGWLITKVARLYLLTQYRAQSCPSRTNLDKFIPSTRPFPFANTGTIWQPRSTWLGSTKPNAHSSAIGRKRTGSSIEFDHAIDLLASYSNHRTHRNSILLAA